MTDRITLTIPRERSFHGVAHFVLGGLALRQHLTLEALDDLQLALDELLDDEGGEITIEWRVQPGAVEAELGPFASGRLRVALDRERVDGSPAPARVLATVCDEVEVVDRDGRDWVILRKVVAEPVA